MTCQVTCLYCLSLLWITATRGTGWLSYISIVCFRLLWSICISPQTLIYSRLSDCSRWQNHIGSIQKTQTAVHPRVFCLVLFQKWSISKYLEPRFVPWSVKSETGCLKHRWSLFADWETPGMNGPQFSGNLVLMGSHCWFLSANRNMQSSCIGIMYLLVQFLNAKCSWIRCHSENHVHVVHDGWAILDEYRN